MAMQAGTVASAATYPTKNNRIVNPESLRTWYPRVVRNSCNLPEKHAGKLKDSYNNVATAKIVDWGDRSANNTRWSPQGII